MPELQLTITPRSPEFITGESIPIEVVINNVGSSPTEVHSADSPSQFEFILQPEDPQRGARVLSATRVQLERDNEPIPPLPFEMTTLQPGAGESYQDDLASLSSEPLATGNYQLSVAYTLAGERFTSNPIPLLIVAPRVSHMATAASLNGEILIQIFSHQAGNSIVLHKESRPERPADGEAFRRVTIDSGAPLSGVATAYETEDGGPEGLAGRWFAWQQGESLGAGVAQRATLFAIIEPVPIALQSVTLHSSGWQPTVNDALFAAIGHDSQNQPHFALVTFSARSREGKAQAFPLTLSAMPAFWAVRYRSDEGQAKFDLIAAQSGTDTRLSTRLSMQTVDPSARSADSLTTLLERPEPLAALALYPVAGVHTDSVDALFGPAGDPAQMTFLRIPLNGGAPIMEFSFKTPFDQNGNPPEQWTLASTPLEKPAFIAKFGKRIIGRYLASGSGSFVLDGDADPAQHLRLEAMTNGLWAIWADPLTGLQYRPVP